MTVISPHTTRAPGTILTAAIYNLDHGNHIANAQALNAGKIEGAGSVADSTIALFDGVSGSALKGSGVTLPLGTTSLADNSVTYAKLQDVSATSRILCRKSSGAGDVEEGTLSEVLDFIGSAAQGDILMRGASAWQRLAAGTDGHFLKSNGAGADLSYAGSMTLLASGSVSSAATLDLVLTAYTAYRGLIFVLSNWLPVTDNVGLQMRVSTDGGTSYDAGASDYKYTNVSTFSNSNTVFGSDRADSASSMLVAVQIGNGADEGTDVIVDLLGQANAAKKPRVKWHATGYHPSNLSESNVGAGLRNAAQDTDAVRFLFSSGNISSGDYAIYGLA